MLDRLCGTASIDVAFLVELDVASEVEAGELAFVRLRDRDIEAPHISLVIPKHDSHPPPRVDG